MVVALLPGSVPDAQANTFLSTILLKLYLSEKVVEQRWNVFCQKGACDIFRAEAGFPLKNTLNPV